MKIVLSGEPKSTNNLYRSTCSGKYPRTYMTALGKQTKEQYQWEAKSQWRGDVRTGDVTVNVVYYFKDKRRRDLDNQTKIVLDSLEGIVYENDTQISELTLIRERDKESPRIEVHVV